MFALGAESALQGRMEGCVVGSVGDGKFNKDHGITAPRNNVHALKRHCQNATEAGPAACLQLGCYCSACVCTACPPWH